MGAMYRCHARTGAASVDAPALGASVNGTRPTQRRQSVCDPFGHGREIGAEPAPSESKQTEQVGHSDHEP
jgi:hypothetical protein